MQPKRRKSSSGQKTPSETSETTSLHSLTYSNDYFECLYNYFKMPLDQSIPKAHWDEALQHRFCIEYVDWKTSKKWEPNASSDAN